MKETRLDVRLTPRGGADRIEGWAQDAAGRPLLKVRVSAPPVEGEANAALEKLLAKALGLPRSAVSVAAGQTSRVKSLAVTDLTLEEIRARLA